MYRNIYQQESDRPQKVQDVEYDPSKDHIYGIIEHGMEKGRYLEPQRCDADKEEGVAQCHPMYPGEMIENNSTVYDEDYS